MWICNTQHVVVPARLPPALWDVAITVGIMAQTPHVFNFTWSSGGCQKECSSVAISYVALSV